MKLSFILTLILLSLTSAQEMSEEPVASVNCGCFCFNMGPLYRRRNRANQFCKDKASCAVRECRRAGRRGFQCCNATPSPTPSVSATISMTPSASMNPSCECRCRRGERGRTLARMACRGKRMFCKVERCRRANGAPLRFRCCDRAVTA